MGKMVTMLTMLICIDIMFIVLSLIPNITISSILLNSITSLGSISFSDWVGTLLGKIIDFLTSPNGSLAAFIGVGAAITAGITFKSSDTLLFIPMAITLGLLASDYTSIASYLYSFSPILATMIMSPIIIMFVFIAIEWARGKD